MKKALSILLLACLSLTLLGMTQDIARANNSEDIKTQILTYTEEWFRDNFSEHYDISGYSANISNFQKNDAKVYAEIAIGAITTLKYDSVEELPYMRGIKDKLKINSLAEIVPTEYVAQASAAAAKELQKAEMQPVYGHSLSVIADENYVPDFVSYQMAAKRIVDGSNMSITETQAMNLSKQIADAYIDAAECIGVGTLLTLDLSIESTYSDGKISHVTLYESDDGNVIGSADEVIPQTAREMTAQAKQDIVKYLKNNDSELESITTNGLSTYDRVAARDYAWEHTYPGYGVNTYNKDEDGWLAPNDCGHGYYVDRSFWNNEDYPTATCLANEHCHSDCACFVSQCLVAGGVPMSSTWQFKSNGSPTYAWHNVNGLKNYMTNNGYWDKSTFSACNAGNVVYTSSGHVTLCTLNDTATRRYTAHTNDRNNKIYSSVYACYVINGN